MEEVVLILLILSILKIRRSLIEIIVSLEILTYLLFYPELVSKSIQIIRIHREKLISMCFNIATGTNEMFICKAIIFQFRYEHTCNDPRAARGKLARKLYENLHKPSNRTSRFVITVYNYSF